MDSDFTQEQIDDARRMVVDRYGQMLGQRKFHGGSTESMIQAAAAALAAEHYFGSELAEIAAREAAAFIARGGRRS